MPFVTRLVLSSGDRGALDGLVESMKRDAERKGLDFRGPHTASPETFQVPLYRRTTADDDRRYAVWPYTVYKRTLEFTGHDETVRSLLARDIPTAVQRAVEVTLVRSVGGR